MSIIIYPITVTSQKYISKIREEFPIIRKKEKIEITDSLINLSYFPVISAKLVVTGTTLVEGVDYEWISKKEGVLELYNPITGETLVCDYETSSFTDEQILSVLVDALNSHNFERKQIFTFSDLPDQEFPLVIWLAKAFLCFDKAQSLLSAIQYSDIVKNRVVSKTDMVSLGLGGFSVSMPLEPDESSFGSLNATIVNEIATAWRTLGQEYQNRYNERMGLGAYRNLITERYPKIKVSSLTHKQYKTNRKIPYEVDRPPAPVKLFEPVVRGEDVIITWTPIYEDDFYVYKIVADKEYIVSPQNNEYEKVVGDNHITTATLKGLSGTYYIAVYTYNTNLLYSISNVVTVTI